MHDHCPQGPRFDLEAIPLRFKPIGGPCPHDLQDGSRSLDIAGHGRIQHSELPGIQSGPSPRTHHIASAVLPSLVNPDSVILMGTKTMRSRACRPSLSAGLVGAGLLQLDQLALEVGLQTGAVVKLDGSQLFDLFLQHATLANPKLRAV